MATIDSENTMNPRKREMVALICGGLGLYLALCLFSFHELDPSLTTLADSSQVSNWGGLFGAYVASLFRLLWGDISFFFVGYFLLASWWGFKNQIFEFSLKHVPFTFTLSIFAAVLWFLWGQALVSSTISGGLLGEAVGSWMRVTFGVAGAWLLTVVGLALSFILALQVSLIAGVAQSWRGIKGSMAWLVMVLLAMRAPFLRWSQRSQDNDSTEHENSESEEENYDTEDPEDYAEGDSHDEESEDDDFEENVAAPVAKPRTNPMRGTAEEPLILPRMEVKTQAKHAGQLPLAFTGQGYQLPALSLITPGSRSSVKMDDEQLRKNARLLEKKLLDFAVEGKVTEIHPGPVITMYEFQPAPGIKLSRISNLADDLSMAMGGRSVRVVAPLPNKPAVGIEIPNAERETVWLHDVMATEKFQKATSPLMLALGKDISGQPYVSDLAKMPHLLVAGATGAGKSVSINSMILSVLYKAKPEEVRFIMVDPKMLELSIYEGIPHLLLPVVTQPKKAVLALKWALREMERRYTLLSDVKARNIQGYNQKIESGQYESTQAERLRLGGGLELGEEVLLHNEKLPYLVIIIDELADLMMVAGKEIEECIIRLAQMARASGIHLIIATQRPSVDVITGLIKANFPARVAFRVSSKHDSRTVIDGIGAERLLGMGDMLCIPPGATELVRAHGAFLTDNDVSQVVDFLKGQGRPVYNETILQEEPSEAGEVVLPGQDEPADEFYDQAVALVAKSKQPSISMIQRRLRIGYNRAARMIEQMEEQGIISPPNHQGQRQVLITDQSAS